MAYPACTWRIPTLTSRPRHSPRVITAQIVARALEPRRTLKRCAKVIWCHLTRIGDKLGRTVAVSLSSGARKKRVRPGIAADVVLRASTQFAFAIAMVQADNGPEFGRYFEQRLTGQNISVRHSRLGRPNGNAYIERFSRTVQEECLGTGSPTRQRTHKSRSAWRRTWTTTTTNEYT